MLKTAATSYVAPSKVAARFMFGDEAVDSEKCILLPNAIYADDFRFNATRRREMRSSLGVGQGALLLGSVGRLVEQKNQIFDIAVLRELVLRGVDAHLILLGKGPLREELEHEAVITNVGERVHFVLPTHDVASYYSAFDVLLLPSRYEGMPNVLVEAQASGLTCVVSDFVTRDAAYSPFVTYLGIGDHDVCAWANVCRPESITLRERASEYLVASQFNMANAVKIFEDVLFPYNMGVIL